MASRKWDVFISHASEDKPFVSQLADGLTNKGVRVWYDKDVLMVGNSLRKTIDEGLGQSEYGVVVLSKSFFAKSWTLKELDALTALGTAIFPILHGIDPHYLQKQSPLLAGLKAIDSKDGVPRTVERLFQALRPSKKGPLHSVYDEPAKEESDIRITFLDRPSQAVIRTAAQLVLVKARKGSVADYMIQVLREVLHDLSKLSKSLIQGQEFLQLRGVWFDDKNGGVALYFQLLCGDPSRASLSEDQIKELFHDGWGWYQGQSVTVMTEVVQVRIASDSFFEVSDQFYENTRQLVHWV